LVDAFLNVVANNPKVKLVMAGPDEWGVEKNFKDKIIKAGANKSVIFPGMLVGQEKEAFLNRADLFCLPSDAEGFSMSILEALAHSVPVVISPGCHFDEVEGAGVGLVRDPYPEVLADTFVELIHNPARVERMAQLAGKFVRENYTWEIVSGKLLESYQGCVSQQSRGHAR